MNIYDSFLNPSNEYKAVPFWCWNGELKKEELYRQIDVLKDMGFGGFFMHSRTGLVTHYLGEEWFDIINSCADYAQQYNMGAWLYDEDRWPSGTAGGEITKNPKYRMRHIKLDTKVDSIQCFDGLFYSYFLIKFDGDFMLEYHKVSTMAEYKTKLADLQSSCKKGERVELNLFIEQEMACSAFYNGTTYIDTLSRGATLAFIDSTHEKYVKKCGDRLGKSIPGVFTDEPHRGGLMTSFSQSAGDAGHNIPYTAELFSIFKNTYGYDLSAKLPEIYYRRKERDINPIKWQYVELIQQLFIDNYAIPIDEYCKKHDMILTGHILHENDFTCQVALSGSVMRYYEYMEYPGIDFLGQHDRCYWIAKQLQSVGRQFGKKFLLSEMYGCTGWQMQLEDYKAIGDWQSLYGINLRCPHLSWYTMQGQAKRDYPASIMYQSAWWKEYAYLEDYYSRITAFLSDGKAACDLLVINPVESVWAQVRIGWCNGLSAADENVVRLEKIYAETFYNLQRSHIDFDYGDEDHIARYAVVNNGKITIKDATYSTVFISGMDTIRSTTLAKLQEFVASGGRVVVAGDVPEYVDCLPSAFLLDCKVIKPSREAIAAELSENAVSIKYCDGSDADDILCQTIERDGNICMMLINDNREAAVEAVLTLDDTGVVNRFIPETGEIQRISCVKKDGKVMVPIDMPAVGSMLLSIGEDFSQKSCGDLPEENEFTLDEDNVLVLDYASVKVGDEPYSESMEILRADRYIREKLDLAYRGQDMLQPWFAKLTDEKPNGTATLRFSFNIVDMPKSAVKLVMENPGEVDIAFNNTAIKYVKNDFLWVDICYNAIEIPPELLKIGENVVEITAPYVGTTDTEAIYIFGDFSVEMMDGCYKIAKPRKTIKFGDITTQGLPFYTGKITYRCRVDKKLAACKALKVGFEKLDSACITIAGNNISRTVAFKPLKVKIADLIEGDIINITAVLTRKNVFGPLHCVPTVTPSTGPMHFETTGKHFSNDYGLIKNGILTTPKLYL